MAHDVYISYAQVDRAMAHAVCEAVEADGVPCWIRERNLVTAANYAGAILEAITTSRVLVLVFSSATSAESQVSYEVDRAIARGVPIVPFRVENVVPSGSLGFCLAAYNYIDAFSPSPEAHLGRLTQAVRELARPAEKPRLQTRPAAAPPQQLPRPAYDVFISYRRGLDAQSARLIRAELQSRRWKVFLDVDDLRAGQFDEALLERIRETPDFVLILSTGSLDRCDDPDDWLRREIVCALANGKTLVPVLMPGFAFPTEHDLPEELHSIRVHNGVPYSHEYFGATMDKVVGFLGASPPK